MSGGGRGRSPFWRRVAPRWLDAPMALCKSPSRLPWSTMEARAPGQCSLSRRRWHGANPLPPPSMDIGMDHAASDGAIAPWQIYLTPRPAASVHLTARELTSRKRSGRLTLAAWVRFWAPGRRSPGQGPSEGDIGLEAAPAAQYGPPRARGRRIELAPRGSSATGQPSLIQIASPTFTPTARLEPNGKYIRVVRISFCFAPLPQTRLLP